MIRLLYFTRTQERRREGVFVCLGMKEMGGLYSSGRENIDRKSTRLNSSHGGISRMPSSA